LKEQHFENEGSSSDKETFERSKKMGKANSVVKIWQSYREKRTNIIVKKVGQTSLLLFLMK